MKRKIFGILSLMLCLVLCISAAACGKQDGGDTTDKHEAKTEWLWNEAEHWHDCATEGHTDKLEVAAHAFNAGVITVEPTETATGEKTFTCTVCGYAKKEVLPALGHKHSFGTEWKTSDLKHWHECACGEKSEEEAHKFGEWNVIKPATETEAGEKERVCSVCDYKETAKIPMEAHTHKFAAEWTYDDLNHWHASTCGHEVKEAEAAHNFNDGVITKEPTETATGEKTFTCTVCGFAKKEVLPALGHKHSFGTEWKTSELNHWHECACGEKSEIAAHIFGEWKETKPATETAKGEKERACTVCAYKETAEIPQLAHTHKFATEWTYDDLNHWHASTCGHDVKEAEAAHTLGDWTIKTPAGYGVNVVEEKACTVCDYAEERTIEKSSLDYTGDFYMAVNDVFSMPNGEVLLTGTVTRGKVNVGDKIEKSGYAKELTVQKVAIGRNEVQSAGYGDGEITISLGTGVNKGDFSRGNIISKQNSVELFAGFATEAYFFKKDEGGRHTPWQNDVKLELRIGYVKVATGKLVLSEETGDMVLPGDTQFVTVVLDSPVPLYEGLEINCISGGATKMLRGTVQEVVEQELEVTFSAKRADNVRTKAYNGAAVFVGLEEILINGTPLSEITDEAILDRIHYAWRERNTKAPADCGADITLNGETFTFGSNNRTVGDELAGPCSAGEYEFVFFVREKGTLVEKLTVPATVTESSFKKINTIDEFESTTAPTIFGTVNYYTVVGVAGGRLYVMQMPENGLNVTGNSAEAKARLVSAGENNAISLGGKNDLVFARITYFYGISKYFPEGSTDPENLLTDFCTGYYGASYEVISGMLATCAIYRQGWTSLSGDKIARYKENIGNSNNTYGHLTKFAADGTVTIYQPRKGETENNALRLVKDGDNYVFTGKDKTTDTRESFPVFIYKLSNAAEKKGTYEFKGNLNKDYDGTEVSFNMYKDMNVVTENGEDIGALVKMGMCKFLFVDGKGKQTEARVEDDTVYGPKDAGSYTFVFQIGEKGEKGIEWVTKIEYKFDINYIIVYRPKKNSALKV